MANLNIAIEIAARDAASGVVGGIKSALGGLGDIAGGAVSHALGNVLTGALNMAVQGIQTLGSTIVDSVDQASALAESTSKIGVVFGESAAEVMAFAETASTALGQSKNQALEAAGTYGNLLTSIGVSTDAAADMSIEMVQLASDLASFNNASPEDTLNALRSALTGETEPMKRFGVALSAAAVEQQALTMGLIKNKNELTPAIRAQATYALMMEQTTNAQGDFARTSDGLANRQRIMAAQWEDLQIKIGQMALPAFEAFTQLATTSLMPMLGTLVDRLAPLGPIIAQLAADVIAYLQGVVIPAFMGAVDWIVANWPQIQASIAATWAVIAPILAQIGAYITGVVVPAIGALVTYVIANWPLVQAAIITAWTAMQPALAAIGAFITGVIIPAFQAAVAWITENWPAIQVTVMQVMTIIQAGIQAALAGIQAFWVQHGDAIMSVVNTWVAWISAVFTAFSAAFQGDWYSFGENLRVAWDAVWGLIQAGVTAAIDYFSGIDWGAVGLNILRGIAAGITAGLSIVAEAARAAAAAALDAAKGFLGIQSPSTAFAEVGQYMMQGMAQGVRLNAPAAVGATTAAAGGALAAAGGLTGGNNSSSVGSVTFNISGGDPNETANAVLRVMTDLGLVAETRLR